MTKRTEYPVIAAPPEIMDDFTRREFLVGGAAALLLGGCGSSGDSEASGETKTVEHAMGTTEVPVSPERVIALQSLQILEPLLQLGIVPIGTVETENILSDSEGIERVGSALEPSLEAIATLEPDLIIGDRETHEGFYEQLSEIAPTVVDEEIFERGPLSRQRFLAQLVGKKSRFEELVAGYEGRVEGIRERLDPMLDSLEVSPLNPYAESDTMVAYRGSNLGGIKVFNDLGISLSAGIRELPNDGSPFPSVSFELLPDLDADVIFALFDPRSDEEEKNGFRDSELLATTFAAGRDQIFEVNSDPWYGGSILALNLVLDDIERYLVDRDIDTSGGFR